MHNTILCTASFASAQTLSGDDTAPGDSCTEYPNGASRMTADADDNGRSITLICNGTTWEPDLPDFVNSCNDGDNVVFDGDSGRFRCESGGGGGGGNLGDLADVVITDPDDGVALVFNEASGNWVNKSCIDTAIISFAAMIDQDQNTSITWLSDRTTDAADRVTQTTQEYQLPNGTRIADNWTDLIDGSLTPLLIEQHREGH